jgi:hypothetical protein
MIGKNVYTYSGGELDNVSLLYDIVTTFEG